MPVVLVVPPLLSPSSSSFYLSGSNHSNTNIVPISIMGRAGARLPGFCLSKTATRVQMQSPPIESKPALQPSQPPETSGNEEKDSSSKKAEPGAVVNYVGRKAMVAVDSSAEAKCALQWALSHAVQSSDTVVLLDVAKPSKYGEILVQDD